MKATVLLTLGLFLASAPSPDSATIAEFSANFIVPDEKSALQAAEGITGMTAYAAHSWFQKSATAGRGSAIGSSQAR